MFVLPAGRRGGGGGGGGGGQHTAVKPSFSKVFNPGFKLRK